MKEPRRRGAAPPADLCIIAKFKMPSDALMAEQVVEDFVNALLEQRYPDVRAFAHAWERRIPGMCELGPNQTEFDLALHEPCVVKRQDNAVRVERVTSGEIGGIIKLLLLKSAVDIVITGRIAAG